MGTFGQVSSAKDVGNAPAKLNTDVVDPAVTEDSSAGYERGSLWINTSTNNAFRCADASVGAAVWDQIDLAASGTQVEVVHKPVDTSRTNQAPLLDDPNLFFAAGSGETWIIECLIFADAASATPDIFVAILGSFSSGRLGIGRHGTASGHEVRTLPMASGSEIALVNTEIRAIYLKGAAVTSAVGNIRMSWSQGTSSGDATTVHSGSYIRGVKI